jgi:endonuclease YncB( thermonuclease family)
MNVRVIKVIDGETILTQAADGSSVRVKLLGVAPPVEGQPFHDEARQHLSDLILSKEVAVIYTRWDDDNEIIGTVLSSGNNINLQMVRDGVAWRAHDADYYQSAEEKVLFVESEKAARNERRGLWSQGQPISPWAFLEQKAQEEPDRAATLNVPAPPSARQPSAPVKEKVVEVTWPQLPPASGSVRHVCKGAKVPGGYVVTGEGKTDKCEGITLAVKRAAQGDIVCTGSPIPKGFLVTAQEWSAMCGRAQAVNALRIEEENTARREAVARALYALRRAFQLHSIRGNTLGYLEKMVEASKEVSQAIMVLPDGDLRNELASAALALNDAVVVLEARGSDTRLSDEVLLALNDRYNLHSISEGLMDDAIINEGVGHFNNAARLAREQGFID